MACNLRLRLGGVRSSDVRHNRQMQCDQGNQHHLLRHLIIVLVYICGCVMYVLFVVVLHFVAYQPWVSGFLCRLQMTYMVYASLIY